jgi:hypothetical protein
MEKYDIPANSWVHRILFQYGPYEWQGRVSDCGLWLRAFFAILVLPFRPLYKRFGVGPTLWSVAGIGWSAFQAYHYETLLIIWSHVPDKDGVVNAALVEYGFSWWFAEVFTTLVVMEAILPVAVVVLVAIICVVGGLYALKQKACRLLTVEPLSS